MFLIKPNYYLKTSFSLSLCLSGLLRGGVGGGWGNDEECCDGSEMKT